MSEKLIEAYRKEVSNYFAELKSSSEEDMLNFLKEAGILNDQGQLTDLYKSEATEA